MSLFTHIPLRFRIWIGIAVIVCVAGISYALASEVEVPHEILDIPKPQLLKKANTYLNRNEIDSALITLTTIVSYSDPKQKMTTEDAEAVTEAYVRLAGIHYNRNSASNKHLSYTKAYRYYSQAVEIGETYNLQNELAEAYMGLGVLYDIMGYAYEDKSMADTIRKLYRRGLEYSLRTDNTSNTDLSAKNLAVESLLQGVMKESDSILALYYRSPLPTGKDRENSLAVRYYCRALQAIAENNPKMALMYTDSVIMYARQSPVNMVNAYGLRADIFHNSGDNKRAMEMLDSTQRYAKALDDLWINLQVIQGKSSLYEEMGMTSKADSCLSQSVALRKKMLNDGCVGEIKDLHFLNQIDSLNSELTRMALERTYTRRLLILAGIALAVFIVMLIIIWRAYRKLKESQRHIFEEYNKRIHNEPNNISTIVTSHTPDDEPERCVPPLDEKGQDLSNDIEKEMDEEEPQHNIELSENETRRYQGRQLSEDEKQLILRRIQTVLNDDESIFMPKFQIKDLANEVGQSVRVISQVINEKLGCNFATVLAEYRIKAVCRKISDSSEFRKLTVEAMAETVGIQSRSYFSTTFKKVTGLSPSTYIRQANRAEMEKYTL